MIRLKINGFLKFKDFNFKKKNLVNQFALSFIKQGFIPERCLQVRFMKLKDCILRLQDVNTFCFWFVTYSNRRDKMVVISRDSIGDWSDVFIVIEFNYWNLLFSKRQIFSYNSIILCII